MMLTVTEFVLWAVVVFMAGSVTGVLAMFVLIYLQPERPPVLSDAEDWALHMANREPWRIDLTVNHDEEPTQLRVVK